ncbi:MAG: ExbD/TolR family protein [Verrucomicrobiales bacterium]
MRRFSQRNSLVTLNDINITPLLDLAFVLLIIFIITTPLLEQSIALDLPGGGPRGSQVSKLDVRTIEVSPKGFYVMQKREMPVEQLRAELTQEFRQNPNLALYIRADRAQPWEDVAAVMDMCQKIGIKKVKFATDVKK